MAIIAILAALLLPALSKAKEEAKAIGCVNNVGEILKASLMYMDDNQNTLMPLYFQPGSPYMPSTFHYNPSTYVVQNANGFFWEDNLRVTGYAKSVQIFNCPAVIGNAVESVGGGLNTNYPLGIGINYPEIGVLADTGVVNVDWTKSQGIQIPSGCIGFADAGSVISTSFYLNGVPAPDNWVPDTKNDAAMAQMWGGGATYFRDPSDPEWVGCDALSVPRHIKRSNFGFMDGHAQTTRNSAAGYRYPYTSLLALWPRSHLSQQ